MVILTALRRFVAQETRCRGRNAFNRRRFDLRTEKKTKFDVLRIDSKLAQHISEQYVEMIGRETTKYKYCECYEMGEELQ